MKTRRRSPTRGNTVTEKSQKKFEKPLDSNFKVCYTKGTKGEATT